MDAVALLIADHNRVRGLFARYEEAHDNENVDEAAKLVAKIVEDLDVHTTIEEEVFYPAIHELKEDIAESVDEGVEEHHVAKILIKELDSLSPTDGSWTAKVTVLIESVEHHVDEEEEQLIPHVRGASNAAWLKVLAGKLEAKQKRSSALRFLPTRSIWRSPNSRPWPGPSRSRVGLQWIKNSWQRRFRPRSWGHLRSGSVGSVLLRELTR